jgi:serine/threonine-protein kinase
VVSLGCPSDTELVALLASEAGRDAVVAFDAHIDECASCRAVAAAVLRVATHSSGNEMMPSRPELDAPPGSTMLVPGDELGRYRIERVLGAGGMGVVYGAFDRELERRVAIKVVRPRTPDEAAHRRLLREARMMAKLENPGVIRVYDVTSVDDRVLVVMELVDGMTLRAFQAERSLEEVLDAYCIAGRALAAAHKRGLVHRDFKPDNVLVSADGEVKVTDFGLATVRGDDADAGGVAMGTLPYMPPEQHRGEPVDARADQFSFAAALHEAVYGVRPFGGADSEALLAEIAEAHYQTRRTDVPAWVAPVLSRALAFEPRERYASMPELLAALEAPRSERRFSPWLAVALAAGALAVVGLRAVDSDRPSERAVAPTAEASSSKSDAPLPLQPPPAEPSAPGPSAPSAAFTTAHTAARRAPPKPAPSPTPPAASSSSHRLEEQIEVYLE